MASQALAQAQVDRERREFFSEALNQGKCAVSRSHHWSWHPHHVVRWQDLRRLRLPRYDRRNVLRITEQVHVDHHKRKRVIRTVELLDCNIAYAVEVMGTIKGVAYLRRRYDDTTQPDPRLEALCPAA